MATARDTRPYVDQITNQALEHPLRIIIMGLALLSVVMDWVTISIMGGGGQSAAGYSILGGRIYLGVVLMLIIVELVFVPLFVNSSVDSFNLAVIRRYSWIGSGIMLTITAIGSLLYINSEIDEMQAELGIFAGAVEASIGLGLYLAIIAAIGIFAIGYTSDGPTIPSQV